MYKLCSQDSAQTEAQLKNIQALLARQRSNRTTTKEYTSSARKTALKQKYN